MKYCLGRTLWMVLSVLAFQAWHSVSLSAQQIESDEHRIRWPRDESASRFRRPVGPNPVTVATKDPNTEERYLPLDEAIRLALDHSEVIRVLTGVSATSSGQTIYDTAIAVTPIDVAKAPFDPIFRANTAFRRNDTPFLNGAGTAITGSTSAGNISGVELADRNQLGGTSRLAADYLWESQAAGGFDYQNVPGLELSYTQPILAGAGFDANRAPIVIARLRQEQSYFQFKNSMQGLVRDVISGYWSLVQARTELWAAESQVELLQFEYDRIAARAKVGIDARDDKEAQAKSSLANAKARRIQTAANVLQREAALRNLVGLPPEDGIRLVPSTPPTRDRVEFQWEEIVDTAQLRRPDLIELNLVLMADQQQLVRSRNLARPSLDAQAIHRWDGLQGRTLAGQDLSAPFDNNTDWTLGVTFSVPLSLRESRANLRNSELLIARDRANIQQSIHQIEHSLATTLRNIDLNLGQYEAFREAREAALRNMKAQEAKTGNLANLLAFLQAVNDWANVVSLEAQALASYNTELANLEEQTGTILETHGIRFVEERFASIGSHGRLHDDECYPRDLRPNGPGARYPDSGKPAEEAFDLKDRPRRIRTDVPEPNDASDPEIIDGNEN
ncbi:MAG: TolC family protein [Planctomycetota bacterium]